MGSAGGSTVAPAPEAPAKVLFVTGRLAEPALRRVLEEMRPRFETEVAVLKITVAALMTTPWIARFLEVPPGTELILLPGLVEGETGILAERFGVRVEKGPKDLREIPRYFGQALAAIDYGPYDIEILAEINNAAKLSREAIRAAADYFQASGADVIDVGCTPGVPFPALGDVVRELRDAGMRVSVDSFEPAEIRAAVEAGAELVLSVNRSNREVARELAGSGARVVAIPDFGEGIETLPATIEALERWGVGYLIDPVILEYDEAELRRLHAEVKDPNFRIFTDRTTITVFNHELFVRGTDIQEIFAQLGVDEATHAFYLGRELAKAKLAITLGKTYRQEGALSWGYLTPPDDVRSEHVKLTQRRRRPGALAARRGKAR